jgi:hypothetical protein
MHLEFITSYFTHRFWHLPPGCAGHNDDFSVVFADSDTRYFLATPSGCSKVSQVCHYQNKVFCYSKKLLDPVAIPTRREY